MFPNATGIPSRERSHIPLTIAGTFEEVDAFPNFRFGWGYGSPNRSWRVGIGGDLPDMKTAARCQVELGWSARETQHLEHMVFYMFHRFQPFFWSKSKLTVHTAIQYDSVTKRS